MIDTAIENIIKINFTGQNFFFSNLMTNYYHQPGSETSEY